MLHDLIMCLTLLRNLRQSKLCEIETEIWGVFNTLDLATIKVDGAVEVLADRDQKVIERTARMAAENAHSLGSASDLGIDSMQIDLCQLPGDWQTHHPK